METQGSMIKLHKTRQIKPHQQMKTLERVISALTASLQA